MTIIDGSQVPFVTFYGFWAQRARDKEGLPPFAETSFAIRNTLTGGWRDRDNRIAIYGQKRFAKRVITLYNMLNAEIVEFAPDGRIVSRESYSPNTAGYSYMSPSETDWAIVVPGF